MSEEYFSSLKAHRIPEQDDILYSAVGATLGIPAIVNSAEPFCFQQHVAILKPDRKTLDTRFAWHMLRSRTVFDTAWRSTTGSAQPTVPLRAIKQLPIPVPPQDTQRQIASYLDDLDAKVDSLRTIQEETTKELNALLPSILSKAFGGDL